jgi:uncharacterized repeat protein (TIGR03803 family)
MKIFIKNPWLLPGLVAGLCRVLVWPATAQTFTTLYSFTDWPDGQVPKGSLALSSNTLYGTTSGGGESASGTVFAINTDGTGYTNLCSFEQIDMRNANVSGGYPSGDLALAAGLRLSGNTLIGTTQAGGNSNNGTVFVLNTNGTGFAALYSFGPNGTNTYGQFTNSYQWFTNSGGALLYAGLILSGDRFYGTTASGGSFGNGTVFAMNTDGTAFTVLHEFSGPTPYHCQWPEHRDQRDFWHIAVFSVEPVSRVLSGRIDARKTRVFAFDHLNQK